MRLLSHKTGFDLADSLHPARYRDNAFLAQSSLTEAPCAMRHVVG